MVCILMAMPLMVIPIILGYGFKYIIQKYRGKKDYDIKLKSSIMPLIIFLTFSSIETLIYKNEKKIIEVHSSIHLPYSNMEVYDAIKSVDTLDVKKPFLMKLDLPIPEKCILDEEKIGSIRTCYFKEGLIIERVTELEKGKILRMDVIDYQLTGRKWLGFKEAIYHFEKINNYSTKMTRITTYTSELYPRIYWGPLEKIGIEQ